VLVSGSGGGAALAADHVDAAGLKLAKLSDTTGERIRAVLPETGNITNPIDVTGAVFYEPTIMGRLLDAVASDPGKPIIATAVNAIPAPHDRMRNIASAIADSARASKSTVITYQVSPLGPLDAEFVEILHHANVPLLMGAANTMQALKHLPRYRAAAKVNRSPAETASAAPLPDWNFMAVRQALLDSGVAVTDAALVRSESEALAAYRLFNTPVAVKAEVPGLLHKSDIGGVRLDCRNDAEVVAAYRAVTENARKAGFADAAAIVQPMAEGIAEAYAGIIDDPLYGPAIVFGLGGIFVEVLKDTAIEMAPLSHADALGMIHRIKAAPLLLGARGRPRGDIDALATLLVNLSRFAAAHAGQIKALDLNPIIVRTEGEGVVAVDVAADPADRS
jgi:acetate---CoA ligase (ADP-forming)